MNRKFYILSLGILSALPSARTAPVKTVAVKSSLTHPAPLRPNPSVTPQSPVPNLPTEAIPAVRPFLRTPGAGMGGLDLKRQVAKKGPSHFAKVEEPSQRTNDFVLKNVREANLHLVQRRVEEPEAYAKMRRLADEYLRSYYPSWKARGDGLRRDRDENQLGYATSGTIDRGFCGGYYYPLRPSQNITAYFEYPVIEWLFVGIADPEYLNGAYGQPDLEKFPETVFPYAGDFFPTETLQDLGIDVSGMEMAKQAHFKSGLTLVVSELRERLSARLKGEYTFGTGEIAVTHFENLRNEVYVVEGFVDGDSLHLPWKAVIDLEDTEQSAIYAAFETEPKGLDGRILDWINDRVLQFGGDPFTVYVEPEASVVGQ